MQPNKTVEAAEREIDEAFGSSPLLRVGYEQSVWTILSVNELAYLTSLFALPEESLPIFADSRINALSYPLRVCLRRSKSPGAGLRREMIQDHYQWAYDWLKSAEYYSQFCSMFPLWHRKRIGLSVAGDCLLVDSSFNNDKAYEAYNRLIAKEGRVPPPVQAPSDRLLSLLMSNVSSGATWFRVNFRADLIAELVSQLQPSMIDRHTLPDSWEFNKFTLDQYRRVMLALQSMLYGWLLARQVLVDRGLAELGYGSSVWVPPVQQLVSQLTKHTGISRSVVAGILDMITFGSNNVREPDIAAQPLIDLKNGFYALSPFVFLNISVERNLCALLNQIPAEREKYLTLVDDKEKALVDEIKEYLTPLGLDCASGAVQGTDLDFALIDHARKQCLCLELKWFIEPAEIRETEDRTKELARAVTQAKKIKALFDAGDRRLLDHVLKIERDYNFLIAVGSVNWIGFGDVQDPAVPIVKVWHLFGYLRAAGSLAAAIEWLRYRSYLPREGVDYSVEPWPISCGKWSATWYGIRALASGNATQQDE